MGDSGTEVRSDRSGQTALNKSICNLRLRSLATKPIGNECNSSAVFVADLLRVHCTGDVQNNSALRNGEASQNVEDTTGAI